MNRFATLLRREWMQHRRGWIVMLALPVLLILLVGLIGHMDIDFDDDSPRAAMQPLAVAAMSVTVVAGITLAVAWGTALLMAPGLARRDQQDRSIEFWVSLPVPHAEAIGATLLAHLLLWPWAALGAGLAGGLVVAVAFVAKAFGVGALASLPWAGLLATVAALALRLVLGILLATLWLAPLILVTMAASAWLKRWGVPAVIATGGLASLLLDKVYGNPALKQGIAAVVRGASHAFIGAERGPGHGLVVDRGGDVDGLVAAAPGWLLHDAGAALAQAASPAFALALAVAALAFGALWLRRVRAG